MFGHLVVVVAMLTCLWLGDWQWFRAETTGSVQNWGYALQWPLFAVCFAVGWWRMLRLESRRLDELTAEAAVASAASPAPVERPGEELADSVDNSGGPAENISGLVGSAATSGEKAPHIVENPRSVVGNAAEAVESSIKPVEKPVRPVENVAPPARAAADQTRDDEDPDDVALAAYNRMLRELAERDAAARR